MGLAEDFLHTTCDELLSRQAQERNVWLGMEIARRNARYVALGPLGVTFLTQLAETGCRESFDMDLECRAAFNAHHMTRGFINEISYSPAVLRNTRDFLSSRTHEGIHAIQFHNCLVAHATPFHAGCKIMLCPRDSMLFEELKERDAFAKEGLILRLIENSGDGYVTPKRMVRDMRAEMGQILESKPRNNHKTMLDYYRDRELTACEDAMVRRHDAEGDITYIRLTGEDILSIGSTLGLSSFGDTPEAALLWRDHAPLTPQQAARIAALNHRFGIADEADLPTLDEALAARGVDRDAFLASSTLPAPESPVSRSFSVPGPLQPA